jgi:ABC-type branched-subunit amino acid transport system permease subunit
VGQGTKRLKAAGGVAAVLFALLGLPILVQRFTGYSAITAAFGVTVVLAALNWWLKNREKQS